MRYRAKAFVKLGFFFFVFSTGTVVAHGPISLPSWFPGSGGGFVPVGGVRPHSLVLAPADPELEPSQDDPGNYPRTAPRLRTTAVFAGISWGDPTFVQDQIAGLTSFLQQFDASPYAELTQEYVGRRSSIGYVGNATLLQPVNIGQSLFVDLQDNELDSSKAFICDALAAGQLKLGHAGNDNFLVFTDIKRQSGNSCAFRAATATWCPALPGQSFRYTVFFDMTEDEQCQVPFHPAGQSRGLASLANFAARSLMQTQTDPNFVGYEDAWHNNLDDLCAWSFHVPFVTFPDGSHWKLQDLWSNRAYREGSGYPNQDGKKGCVNAQ